MRKTLKVFVKVAILCLIAEVFLPAEVYAQTSKPANGGVSYYQQNVGKDIQYMAVKFVDGGVQFLTSSLLENESLQKFKIRVQKEISKSGVVKFEKKTKEEYVYSFSMSDEEFGDYYESLTFSNSFKKLRHYQYSEYEDVNSSDYYELIR